MEYNLGLSLVDEKNKMIKDLCDLNQGVIQKVTKLRSIEDNLKDNINKLIFFVFKKCFDLVESSTIHINKLDKFNEEVFQDLMIV
jgi:hypothetical protein